jgi:hypothetical protein
MTTFVLLTTDKLSSTMNKILNKKVVALRATTFLLLSLIYFTSQAQVLSTDEKIEVLGFGGQSVEIINFAAIADYTLPELEQANQLKKFGIQDKNIIIVLKAKAKFTYDEILLLKEYQTKGYSETIIQKSVDEKPKFQKDAEIQKAPEKKIETEKVNNSNEDKLPKDSITEKITYEETVQVPRMSLDVINSRAMVWINKYLAQRERVEPLGNSAFKAKGDLYLDKNFTEKYEQWMVDQSITFVLKFKCKDGQYTYQFTDFTHSFNPGKTKIDEQAQKSLATAVDDQIKRAMVKIIAELKNTVKPTNNDW